MAPFDADNDDKPLDLGLPSLGVNSQWLHKLIIPHWCKKSPNWRWTVFFKESFETAGIHTVQHRHVVYSGFLQRHQWFVLKKIPKASVGKEVTLLTRLRVWFFRHTAFCLNIHQKTNEKEMANNILRGQNKPKDELQRCNTVTLQNVHAIHRHTYKCYQFMGVIYLSCGLNVALSCCGSCQSTDRMIVYCHWSDEPMNGNAAPLRWILADARYVLGMSCNLSYLVSASFTRHQTSRRGRRRRRGRMGEKESLVVPDSWFLERVRNVLDHLDPPWFIPSFIL